MQGNPIFPAEKRSYFLYNNEFAKIKIIKSRFSQVISVKTAVLDFNKDKTLKITRALNMHEAHGYDDISNTIIKICDKSLLKPLIH